MFPFRRASLTALPALLCAAAVAAAPCGDTSAGFEPWKAAFAQEAAAAGVGERGLQALAQARYSQRTINADRNQTGVRYSFEDFVRIRLGSLDGFAAQARRRLEPNRAFFAALEQRTMGSEPVVSSILTVAYDCRRAEFFTPHAIAALQMVDRGMLSPTQLGAFHGELGHTQFLPGNALRYGVDIDGDGRVNLYETGDALASTANFLARKGWRAGEGYQPGSHNFSVIGEWNAATVYQQAIAAAAARIDR
jgi:membrane-bound lytic murein transglycosylase B